MMLCFHLSSLSVVINVKKIFFLLYTGWILLLLLVIVYHPKYSHGFAVLKQQHQLFKRTSSCFMNHNDIASSSLNERYVYRVLQLKELRQKYNDDSNQNKYNSSSMDSFSNSNKEESGINYIQLVQKEMKQQQYSNDNDNEEEEEEKNKKELTSLLHWIRTQQYEYKRYQKGQSSFLTKERLDILENELNIDWNHHTNSQLLFKRQERWMKQYTNLLQFQQQNNHTRVSLKQNKSLAIWIKNQKASYKKYILNNNTNNNDDDDDWSQQRIQNLQLFHSTIHHDSIYNTNWMKHYHQYKQQQQYNTTMTSPALQKWVQTQRRNYKQYKKYGTTSSSLHTVQQRIQLLKDINFDFNGTSHPKSSLIKWERIQLELQTYQKQNGHINIPTSHPTLGNFVHNLRAEYKRNKVPDYQIQQLNSLGFIWNVHEYHWNKKYKSLLKFYESYGHTNVPMTYSNITQSKYPPPNKYSDQNMNETKYYNDLISLGCWVQSQRQWYRRQLKNKKKSINNNNKNNNKKNEKEKKHRMEKLHQIFFGTKPSKTITYHQQDIKWEEMFQQLVEYQQLHNHSLVPRKYPCNQKLANWVSAQRKQYQSSTLSIYRRSKLQQIGFVWSLRRGPKKKTDNHANNL